ncbi:MAG: argininosuccinate lyase [Candidatus Dormibacteraeota bacterium]|nr:argininosuccinate lyase [Candidatus Dormibacteraeota bacterium]
MPEPRATKLWAGRLGGSTAGVVERYTSSVDVDQRLHAEDVTQSLAHARMLRRIGMIDEATLHAIEAGLHQIVREFDEGAFVFEHSDEDIHSAVERRLRELAGDAAGALQTGRSRNDQVATDLRMFGKRACSDLARAALALQDALLRRAAEQRDAVMPAYTHLQRAQPVTVAHHLLAYVEMLQRDIERLLDARRRCDVLPLGSGAVAGSTLPLDRELTARELGFGSVSRNSIDSVSDRDFAVEITSACALIMVHGSRLAEEIVLWMSREFGFALLPDTHATGSSLMPQKKNPDVAELARGRTARVIGDVTTLLTLIKGLPLSYNRDLQEDKRPLFDAVDTTAATLDVLADVVSVLGFDADAMRRAASDPELMATDAAELLVRQGVPFREAHEIVGALVRETLGDGRTLADLTLDEWREASPHFSPEVLELFDIDAAVARRRTAGGPAPDLVAQQIAAAQERLAGMSTELERLR